MKKMNRQKVYQAAVNEIKLKRGCEALLEDGTVCGYRRAAVGLCFDHRPGTVKIANITALVRGMSRKRTPGLGGGIGIVPWSLIEAEIAKCDVLCHNCHHIRTQKQNDYNNRHPGAPLVRAPSESEFEAFMRDMETSEEQWRPHEILISPGSRRSLSFEDFVRLMDDEDED